MALGFRTTESGRRAFMIERVVAAAAICSRAATTAIFLMRQLAFERSPPHPPGGWGVGGKGGGVEKQP